MPPPPPDSNPVGQRPTTCPECGTRLPMEGRFCGQCGHVLANTPSEPAPVTSPPPAVMAPAAPPAPTAVRQAYRTMIGIAAVPIHSEPPAALAPSAVANAPSVPAPNAPVRNAHQTMMGVSPIAPPAESVPRATSSPAASNAGGPVAVPNAARTMMGAVISEPPRPRSEGPPMMGGGSPGVPPKTVPPVLGQRMAFAPSPRMSSPDDIRLSRNSFPTPRPRGNGRVSGIVVVGVGLAVAATAVMLLWRGHGQGGGTVVQAALESDAHGVLGVTMTLPGEPPGTRVRYAAQTQPIDADGHVRFALDPSVGNRVGAIDLPVAVLRPNAGPQSRMARIVVGYRVDPDLAGLASEPPTLRLLFRVVPGARLSIEGQPVATDASGAGVATMDNYPSITLDAPAVRAQTLHVEVHAPDGTVTQGTYELRVPRSALTVDRPVVNAITAAERVVVRGHAPGARRVTVNQLPIELHGDVFETVVPLAQVGHQAIDVRAFSPNGAPAQAHLDVERVAANDRAAAGRFLQGSTLGASDLARGTLMAGQRVHLVGRMLGVPRGYEGGETFQLIVSDRACGTTPCLVWVDMDPGVTPPNASGTVDVTGTVTGRRASVTTSGERRSDLIVAAAVVQAP